MTYSGVLKFGTGYGRPDERVRWVQRRLMRWGITPHSSTHGRPDDGQFGSGTQAAVETFQRMHGLPVTGTVDFSTWQKLAQEPYQRQIQTNVQKSNDNLFPIFAIAGLILFISVTKRKKR